MVKMITSLQHPIVKHLTKLRKDRSFRLSNKSLVIAGVHQIKEVCCHLQAKMILCTDEQLIPKEVKSEEIILTHEEIIKKISGVQTPEGIIAEVTMPLESTLEHCHYVVALDGINDPGNLGTLLRTALALGWEGVFILDHSADPYNDKALRAAKGAAFRLPLRTGNWEELEKIIKKNKLHAYAADMVGVSLQKLPLNDNVLLVLGNESRGISEKASTICQKITIPMPGDMESLNVAVAGGILMYSLRNNVC